MKRFITVGNQVYNTQAKKKKLDTGVYAANSYVSEVKINFAA